ncbi:G2/mitotic-specific cyclin S13-7-like isoform X2 [Salvia miltiorrhiza]|uniref:G2/mitotic-specific cyclin S13-7-like isoform X2 n=1 Tax=Salvia miltiorrhiza TaxID=226208 RepID=UPI0025AD401D|nr:G2/mitotic-specific cyclin S13-7-like isoform X2 [Salvia miltiorrhiza]
MASTTVVPEQPRGGGKQKIVDRNRRVLKDIGNLVTAQAVERKPHTQITRPVTRSFGAQVLANAQAAAEKNICKKPLVESGNDLVAKPKASKKEAVIVISSDEGESCESGRKARGRSSKKPCKAFTSILSARSKAAACEDVVVDIDAEDADNELAAPEYVEDMYNFYKLTEGDGRVDDYMGSQPEINSKMRGILVDWLIEVHRKFELTPESLYLTVNIVDRFLSRKAVPRRELQLVGISSMLIACKYEEIWAPEVSELVAISDNAYAREQVLLMEKAILGKLEWYLTVPTPYVFLVRYIKASIPSDKEMGNMTFFFAELGLTSYSAITRYSPSVLAASAVYAARCTLGRSPRWTGTLRQHSGYEEEQLMECGKVLGSLQRGLGESKLKAVWRKYSKPERGAVAMLPPSLLSNLYLC